MNYTLIILGAIIASAIAGGIAYAIRAIRKATKTEAEKEQLESRVQALECVKTNKEYMDTLPVSSRLKWLRSPSKR